MRRILPLLVILLSAGLGRAQTVPPALMVKEKDRSEPLRLSRVQTEVRIYGSLAETAMTMTFSNPRDRVLAGDLYFPLPERATVSGYALDIEGKLVDGVAVQKHKGREVFEKIIRQGLDPGLVEWTKGSNFKTRVFPIPAHGSRTIRVEYVSELIGPSGEPTYHLPLRFKEKLDEFTIRVEVVKPAAAPKVRQGELAGFGFERWRDSYVAEATSKDVALTRDLVVALPEVQRQNVLVEKAPDGQTYFCIQDFPKVAPAGQDAPPPKHVVIFWDASGSRGAADHKRELGLLRAYFQHWAASRNWFRPPVTAVDLVLVRHAAAGPKRFRVVGFDPTELITALEQVQYDGGTQLGAITPDPGTAKPDFYMLFSDGLSNFGRAEPAGLKAPLYAFSADATADHAFLRRLATSTGGQYFNLLRMKDGEVIAGIGRPARSFLRAEVTGGKAAGLYPSMPEPLAGRFTLVGKLSGAEATVTLDYGLPGGTPRKRTFKITGAGAPEGSLLRRLWAQKKLAELVVDQKRNEQEIVALGKEHGLVTPFTSLIVLDRLEQYVEHEIAPPKSLPKMREEYMRRIDTLEHQQAKQKADKLQAVVAMWQERVKWWEREFKYPEGFRYKGDKDKKDGATGGEGRPQPRAPLADPGARPATPPAAAQPAPAEAAPMRVRESPAANAGPQRDSEYRFNRLAKAGKPGSEAGRQPGIAIKPWDPKTPYMERLKAASADDAFAVYMKDRAEYGTSPAFFLDCADYFAGKKDADLSLQVLSNVAELELESPSLLRVLGHRLAQTGRLELAVLTFEEVLRLRPEEPQSYRDLALVLARRAEQEAGARNRDAMRDDYAQAIDLLWQVVIRHWDNRFAEIELIALEELNAVLPKAQAAGVKDIPVDKRLVKLLDVDVRIVMTWHADNTDIDLWVIEPSGEKAFYGHNRTTIGGLVSRDFTGGYGPEEYLVRRAMHGTYDIKANYYGSRAVELLGAVTVQVDVFTGFGRPSEQHKSLTLRLKAAKETVDIGQIEF